MTPDDIKRIRMSLGLTQDEMAVRLGVKKNTVWRWEHGVAKPQDLHMWALGVLSREVEQKA